MYKWIQVDSKAKLDELSDFVDPEFKPKEIAERLKEDLSDAVRFILIEDFYVDKDYRSTYYNFYAKKSQNYNQYCLRFHFFDETVSFNEDQLKLTCEDGMLDDHYYGYMILRPTGIATIGRSVLSPDIRNGANGFIIHARHKVHLLGNKLYIEGFPSMDQHIDISVCAHVACWSILRHYSERYSTHKEYLVHDITLMAHQFDPGGLVPSKGLEISHAERVFQKADTYPVYIALDEQEEEDDSFYRQLIAYIESGFPLFAAMHVNSHAIALIGAKINTKATTTGKGLGYWWDQIDSLVAVDDNYLPYLSIPTNGQSLQYGYGAKDIDTFIVALPEKIYYPADAVDRLAPSLYRLSPIINLPEPEKTIIRYFITTGSGFRRFIRERSSEFDRSLYKIFMTLPFPQFIWIVEYATHEDWGKGQISARAIVDATASLRDPSPFWIFHNRERALYYENRSIGAETKDLKVVELNGMEGTALTRMEKNMRRIKPK